MRSNDAALLTVVVGSLWVRVEFIQNVQQVVGVFIKTSKINNKAKDSELSSDSLMSSSYSWKTPMVQYTISIRLGA